MQKPSELELKILSVLWDHGPQTVRAVLELLPDGVSLRVKTGHVFAGYNRPGL